MRAVLIRPEATAGEVVEIDRGLNPLQELVGGYIEHVQLVRSDGRGGVGMYVHDEGLIRGLPVNRLATNLYWHTRAAVPFTGTVPYAIHGPVVVLCGPDYEGDDLPIDPKAIGFLTGLGIPVDGAL